MRKTSMIKVMGIAMLLMVVAVAFPASAEVTTYKINTDGTKTLVNSSNSPTVTIDGNGSLNANTSKPSETIDAFAAVTYHYASATNYRTGWSCSASSSNYDGGASAMDCAPSSGQLVKVVYLKLSPFQNRPAICNRLMNEDVLNCKPPQ